MQPRKSDILSEKNSAIKSISEIGWRLCYFLQVKNRVIGTFVIKLYK